MSQAGLMPLIAAWLRDTQGVEPVAPRPNVTGPAPPPRVPLDLRAPSMYTQDVPRPAYPGPSAADLVRGDQPTITASQRAALRSPEGADPSLERVTGPVETLVAGGGKALWNVGKAATQGVGPLVRELAKLGYVREPILEAGKSRLGYGTRAGKEETRATTAKLSAAEQAVKSTVPPQIEASAPKIPKKHLLRGPDVLPMEGADVPTLKKYFERGAKNPSNVEWYTESKKAGEQLFGEDEPLYRLFAAIYSQRKAPEPETDLAMKAYRAWRNGGTDALKTVAGPSTHQRAELLRGAALWEQDKSPATIEKLGEMALSSGSMKRRDYYGARGDTDVSVIDTHAGKAATQGTFKANDPQQYYGVQHVFHDLADQAGAPRRGYQAAVWVPWREDQARAAGKPIGDPAPAARILMKRAEVNPDFQAMVRQGQVQAPPADWRTALKWLLLAGTPEAARRMSQREAGTDDEDTMTQKVFGAR